MIGISVFIIKNKIYIHIWSYFHCICLIWSSFSLWVQLGSYSRQIEQNLMKMGI